MSPEQIENAIGYRLGTMPGAPTILRANQDADPARPFISIAHHPIMRRRPLSGGGSAVDSGYIALSIVIARHLGPKPANDLAALITARFPAALRLAVAAGVITLTGDARVSAAGYRDLQDWRLPMRIDYRAVS